MTSYRVLSKLRQNFSAGSAAEYGLSGRPESFSMDRDEEYNLLYVRKVVNDDNSKESDFEIPTLHMILLYCEWYVSEEALKQISSLILSRKLSVSKSETFLDALNGLLYDDVFAGKLSKLVGADLYGYACAAIGDGEVAVPLGLAPSFRLFSKSCAKCRSPKYIRSFCLQCGALHDISKDVVYRSSVKRKRSANSSSKKSAHRSDSATQLGAKKLTEVASLLVAEKSLHVHTEVVTDVTTATIIKANEANGLIGTKIASSAEGSLYNVQTKSTSSITTFSLRQLLELSNTNRSAVPTNSSTTPIIPPPPPVSANKEPEFEIILPKKEIVVIDLLDSSDDDAPPAAKQPAKSACSSAQQPMVLIDKVVIKKEAVQPCAPPHNSSGSLSQHASPPHGLRGEIHPCTHSSDRVGESDDDHSYDETASTLDSEEASMVPVKLEWPARRMNKYEMAAMRGIAALYKYGQSGVNPGDMLFLMRNLATYCTGLHRIAARCGFRKLCTQWASAHATHHSNDADCDVLDVIEGTFVLAQLMSPDNASWRMFQETDTGGCGEFPQTATSGSGSGIAVDSISAATATTSATVYEDAEGKQEDENDFAARIDYALSCSNLKFMIYSLTGDRRYHTLKSEPGEEPTSTVDLAAEDSSVAMATNAATAKQSQSSLRTSEKAFSEFIVYPSGYSNIDASIKSSAATLDARSVSSSSAAATRAKSIPERRSNPSRSTKLAMMESLSEEFGVLEQFGDVSPEVARQFMEYAGVVASCKVFIKENLRYTPLVEFIGIDLDKFALPESNTAAGLSQKKGGPVGTMRKPSPGSKISDAPSSTSSSSCTSKHSTAGSASGSGSSSSSRAHKRPRGFSFSGENCVDSKFHGDQVFTGALCWPYITEEIGFDSDLRVDRTLQSYQVKKSTLSKAVAKLAKVRTYSGATYFTSPTGVFDREGYKKQCYFATHVIYAFSDWGQHALRRQLFAEEFEFLVTNFGTVLDVLKDAELVGEFLQCLRILQYTPERDPDLAQLFADGKDFLLRVEREFGSMGRWVGVRSAKKGDIYTQYHATYCAVAGLADANFAQDEKALFNPPVPRILHHLRSDH